MGSDFEHHAAVLELMASAFPPPPPVSPEPSSPSPFVAPGSAASPLGLREIVYRLPQDVDGDGRVLSESTGALEWSPSLYGFLLIPDGSGTLDLVRRRADDSGVTDELVCRWVESLTFDTAATKTILPRNAVEIHLRLRRPDTRSRQQRLHLATTVVMRNTP